MKLYRVVDESEKGKEHAVDLTKLGWDHTFKGEIGEDELLFVLKEQALRIKGEADEHSGGERIETVEIPYKKLAGKFGFVEYPMYNKKKAPLVQVRLTKEDLAGAKVDTSEVTSDETSRMLHARYIKECVEGLEIYAPVQKNYEPVFNKDYNVMRLFDIDELLAEKVDVTNYSKSIVFTRSQKDGLVAKIGKLFKKDNKEL